MPVQQMQSRAKEPSTYAGLGMIVATLVAPFFPAFQTEIAQAGAGLGGLLAILMSEKGPG